MLGFLGEGDSIEGKIELRGGLRIDGRIVGSVRSPSTLVIGPSGEIVSEDLEVRGLSVSGRVRGSLRVEDRLEIHRGGRVEGTVEIGRAGLVIEPGGGFEGTVRIAYGQPIDYVVLVAYFVVILGFGSFFARYARTTKEFFHSGQRFRWWVLSLSALSVVVGSYSFIKYGAVAFRFGLSSTQAYLNDWFLVPLFALGWLPIIYYARVTSIPEYFERRFDRGGQQHEREKRRTDDAADHNGRQWTLHLCTCAAGERHRGGCWFPSATATPI